MEIDLPPWKIFTQAIALIWQKRAFALYISLPIVLLYALSGAAIDLGMIEQSSFDLPAAQSLGTLSPAQIAWVLAVVFLYWFLFSVIAIFWHRNILLGEHSTGTIPLRVDGVVWRYLPYAIATFVLTMLFGLVAGLIVVLIGGGLVWILGAAGLPVAPRHLFMLVLLPLFPILSIAFFRLSLVLPAAAIGVRKFGFRSALLISRGNSWRILVIVLLMFALSILIALLFGGALLTLGPQALEVYAGLPKSLTLTGEAIFYVAQTLISIGVLSLTFAYLTYEGPKGGTEAQE